MSLVIDNEKLPERTAAARFLREARLYMGKTQGEMPEVLQMAEHGVTTAIYSSLENNRGNIPIEIERGYVKDMALALLRHCDA